MKYTLKDFRKILKIGEGTYGVVYKAENVITKEIVALKKIKCHYDDDGISMSTLREVSVLNQLHHPNIITLYQALIDQGRVFLVFEYLDMDLDKYLNAVGHEMNRDILRKFSYEIIQGLEHCHNKGFIHRDLKPQNILVDLSKNIAKLADFGLARHCDPSSKPMTQEVLTMMYRAPEILLETKIYGFSVDVWSVGCIITEMFTGQLLFPGVSEIDQLFRIFEILGTPDENVWPDLNSLPGCKRTFPIWSRSIESYLRDFVDPLALDLISKMLEYFPPNRISCKEALQHKYFAKFHHQMDEPISRPSFFQRR